MALTKCESSVSWKLFGSVLCSWFLRWLKMKMCPGVSGRLRSPSTTWRMRRNASWKPRAHSLRTSAAGICGGAVTTAW